MVSKEAKRPDEFALIAKYFEPLAVDPGAFGLIDDAALCRPSADHELVLTVDTVAAGVHFLPDDPAESIARKALRVNLSDLAAKGARPLGYLLALALPNDWNEEWIRNFTTGLADDQKSFDIKLLGGDTTRASGGLTISITAIGEVPAGTMVLRSGARPGDAICVSGTIGDAALGLEVLRGNLIASEAGAASLRDRYLHPRPRVALAPILRRFASSAMDVSDGLLGDLAHICGSSGVGAEIEAAKVPLSGDARLLVADNDIALLTALTGGDDYEILATVGEDRVMEFAREADAAGVSIARIGRVMGENHSLAVLDRNGKPLDLKGTSYTHF